LLLLTPVVLPLVLSWAAFHDVERLVRTDEDPPARSRWEFVCLHVRHHLILPLAPVLALVATQDVVQLLHPALLVGRISWIVHVLPLTLVAVLLPVLLRIVWPTQRLPDGPLRARLELFCRRCGVRVRDLLIWCSQGRLANAAVCGLIPQLRYVLISDELVRRLSPDQIEAVFAHELGHVRHHHLAKMLFVLSFPLILVLSTSIGTDPVHSQWLPAPSGMAWASGTASVVLSLGYLAVALGAYSRLAELAADVWAVEQLAAGRDGSMPAATHLYLETLELLSATGGGADWLHPSLALRRRFLQKALHHGAAGVLRLRAWLRWVDLLLVTLIVVPPMWRIVA
jgi:STE24 endopeptidase